MVGEGLFTHRRDDALGVGIASARYGEPARRAGGTDGPVLEKRETTIELTYRIQGGRWALQPDLQYVMNPGGDPRLKDAVVLGLRIEATLF